MLFVVVVLWCCVVVVVSLLLCCYCGSFIVALLLLWLLWLFRPHLKSTKTAGNSMISCGCCALWPTYLSVAASGQHVDSKSITIKNRRRSSSGAEGAAATEPDGEGEGLAVPTLKVEFFDEEFLLTPLWRKSPFSIANCLTVFWVAMVYSPSHLLARISYVQNDASSKCYDLLHPEAHPVH